jgi:hypothetical protein
MGGPSFAERHGEEVGVGAFILSLFGFAALILVLAVGMFGNQGFRFLTSQGYRRVRAPVDGDLELADVVQFGIEPSDLESDGEFGMDEDERSSNDAASPDGAAEPQASPPTLKRTDGVFGSGVYP